jgi:hypothetical protein
MRKFMLALLLVFGGCAISPSTPSKLQIYIAKPDQFYPDKVYYFSDEVKLYISPYSNPFLNYDTVLNFNYTKTNDGTSWDIRTSYSGLDWLFVETIRFKVDEKIYSFASNPNPIHDISSENNHVFTHESNIFDVSEELIEALQKASSISVRLEGQHSYQDKTFTSDEVTDVIWRINNMKKLIAENKQFKDIK